MAKGKYDNELVSFAKSVRKVKRPFFLIPYPEANIGSHWKFVHPWAGNGGKNFRLAWKHMYSVFEQEGANEYAIWSLHLLGFGNKYSFDSFAVDDNLVDWVGFTIYNIPDNSGRFKSFKNLANGAYSYAKRNYGNKPIGIWECGTTSGQGKWIKNTYNQIKSMHRIKLVVWAEYVFAKTKNTKPGETTSSFFTNKGREEYAKIVKDPYYISGPLSL